jgi:hypothetical protein
LPIIFSGSVAPSSSRISTAMSRTGLPQLTIARKRCGRSWFELPPDNWVSSTSSTTMPSPGGMIDTASVASARP